MSVTLPQQVDSLNEILTYTIPTKNGFFSRMGLGHVTIVDFHTKHLQNLVHTTIRAWSKNLSVCGVDEADGISTLPTSEEVQRFLGRLTKIKIKTEEVLEKLKISKERCKATSAGDTEHRKHTEYIRVMEIALQIINAQFNPSQLSDPKHRELWTAQDFLTRASNRTDQEPTRITYKYPKWYQGPFMLSPHMRSSL